MSSDIQIALQDQQRVVHAVYVAALIAVAGVHARTDQPMVTSEEEGPPESLAHMETCFSVHCRP